MVYLLGAGFKKGLPLEHFWMVYERALVVEYVLGKPGFLM
jgi:hypothetical protein